jgi:hypothetical protein
MNCSTASCGRHTWGPLLGAFLSGCTSTRMDDQGCCRRLHLLLDARVNNVRVELAGTCRIEEHNLVRPLWCATLVVEESLRVLDAVRGLDPIKVQIVVERLALVEGTEHVAK